MIISPLESGGSPIYTQPIYQNRSPVVDGNTQPYGGGGNEGGEFQSYAGPIVNTDGQQVGQYINTIA